MVSITMVNKSPLFFWEYFGGPFFSNRHFQATLRKGIPPKTLSRVEYYCIDFFWTSSSTKMVATIWERERTDDFFGPGPFCSYFF